MQHPFDLELSELETVNFVTEQEISDEEAEQVSGGLKLARPVSKAGRENGQVTTMALGEEGGVTKPRDEERLYTKAVGEDGGYSSRPYQSRY